MSELLPMPPAVGWNQPRHLYTFRSCNAVRQLTRGRFAVVGEDLSDNNGRVIFSQQGG